MSPARPFRNSLSLTKVLDAVQDWANDELRSVNAQIEYLLREALRKGLTEEGHTVVCASNGREGLEMARGVQLRP